MIIRSLKAAVEALNNLGYEFEAEKDLSLWDRLNFISRLEDISGFLLDLESALDGVEENLKDSLTTLRNAT